MFARLPVSRHDDLGALQRGFASRREAELHPQLRSWISAEALAQAMSTEAATLVGALFDIERAAAKHTSCRLPGLNDQDYLVRLLGAPDGRHAMAELRFKGLRIDVPFVELLATDFAVGPRELEQLLAACAPQFRRARPRWLRVYHAGDAHADARLDELPWLPDLHVLVGRVGELLERPPPPRTAELRLVPAAPGCRERYLDTYARWSGGRPALAREIEPLDPASFDTMVAGGHAYEAFAGERWAGLIGATAATFAGAPAYEVVDQLLDAPFRGTGLGPALQRHLLERLERDALLVGTIHEHNLASLATALRIGRTDIGRWRFYELPRY